jgi:hypothetical protein
VEDFNVDTIGNAIPVIEKCFKPTPKQQKVIELPDTIFEACGGGAAGGGKTDLGLMIPPIRQFTEHPKFKGLVLRRTFADLEKEIIPRQHEWYAPMGAIYNETKKRWKWPTGAIIQNGHAEREQDVRKYDSAEYNYIDWDESTHFTGFQYLYLSISRCRSSSPDLPAIVRSFTNPGNVGHRFFKQRFVDPCPAGGQILKDKVTGQKRIYLPFLGKDNPHLTLNDPTYLARLEGLPEIERKAKLFGDWNSYEGQVFSEFRVLRLSDEPEYAVHVIPTYPAVPKNLIPEWWPRILCIDWGWAAKTFAIWTAIAPNGRAYIYRTWDWRRTTAKIWAREAANLSGEEQIEDLVLCHSAGQHHGDEKTIQDQVNDAFDGKYTIRLADKDRIGGKNMVHEYLRWIQRPKVKLSEVQYDGELAARILRHSGEQKYKEYLQLFVEEEPERNLPKLQILSHGPEGRENKELIDVIPSCVPAENNPEDVAEFDGDDSYDCLRMVVKAAHRFVDQSKDELERRERMQKVLDEFAATQNQTNFQMRMAVLEEEMQGNISVRRHRAVGCRR